MQNGKNIFFLYYIPHTFHKSLAQAVRAKDLDILCSNKKPLRRIFSYVKFSLNSSPYDILLCEGTFLIPALFKILPFKKFKKFIINISADPKLYYIKTKNMNLFKGFMHSLAIPQVDLFICIGEMERDLLREISPRAKFIVAYPFIEEERYNHLLNLPIKERFNHNILFVGNGPDHFCKGIDLLINTFKIVKQEFQDAELFILGNWNKDIKEKFYYQGVHFVGFSQIYEYIEKSSLYLHLGRGEAFSISTIEVLLGGLPAIVSEYTGAKEIVKKLRDDFVVPLDSKRAAEKVIEYFQLTEDDKKDLSLRAKELGKRFKKEIVLSEFINKWNSVMRKL
ncbi:glycosyltransferase family 4 protein [Dictyoglomus turgidum]|uniref:Glycosyl transferase group 1 n=2 Tax=Dictyoglomus TaxID=13 RepID=B8DZ35_DICTD|nr:glycosyltransferase family 4 protein [Dictyoglomus turgidum]ACK41661.1 glycosyl transferase group 1 [Dictyoglomus turgidum DSM 6724]HBU31221.1 hypothetical protein [Dictyoglomus sp.]